MVDEPAAFAVLTGEPGNDTGIVDTTKDMTSDARVHHASRRARVRDRDNEVVRRRVDQFISSQGDRRNSPNSRYLV